MAAPARDDADEDAQDTSGSDDAAGEDAEGGAEAELDEDGEAEADAEVESSGSGLFEQSLATGAASSEADSAGTPAATGFDLSGYVRGDVFVGKVPGFSLAEIKAAYGELALSIKAKKEGYGDGFAEARFRYGLQDGQRELTVDLREAYVSTYFGPFDLRLGHQIVIWGRADAFNPTNNLTPLDLRVRSPVEDDRRVGNFGARLFLNLAPLRLEGVWMPLYRPAELPTVPLPSFVTVTEPNFPGPYLRRGTAAGRLHLELASFETSVSYLQGYAPLPGYAYQGAVGGPDARVSIARTAYDHQVFGFDFSTALGDVLAIRGEAAYRKPFLYEERVYAPRPDVQYVLGLDRAFGAVSVIAQYMGRYTLDWQAQPGLQQDPDLSQLQSQDPPPTPVPPIIEDSVRILANTELASVNQMLFSQLAEVQHLASLRIEWLTLHDTLSLSVLGMMNFTTEERLLYPKLAYRLADGLSMTVGGEIYMGPEGTLFGVIDEQLSAGYAELRASF